MFYKCLGEGSPTVIMEAGLSNTSNTWDPIVHQIAKFTQVFVYDRAGLGSSKASAQPRTSGQMVRELHLLLLQGQLHPQYVLVGHSFGGLNMLLFASQYPDDIAGIVLIDTPHPAWIDHLERILSPIQRKAFRAGGANNREGVTYRRRKLSGRQVQTSGTLPDVPMVAIFAGFGGRQTKWPEGWPTEPLNKVLGELQAELASRTPQGKLVIAQESGHYIHHHDPELIVDVIYEVVEKARRKDAL